LSNRKSLIDLVAETPLRDPAGFAKQRVTSLDNNARATMEKKKQYIKEIDREKDELQHLNNQISAMENRYKLLCDSLNGKCFSMLQVNIHHDSNYNVII
jgi:peptidoglycan hydrolase CwlO-like protein